MTKPPNERALQIEGEITLILSAVAEYFGLSMAELGESTKNRAVVLPRQIAMYIAKQLTRASLQEIGDAFDSKHHTTVMHSIAKIHERRSVDQRLDRAVKILSEKLRPPKTPVN
jgi:chromosomal replication initiator protein